MIEGLTLSAFFKSVISHSYYLAKFFIRRKHFGRYLLVTPSFLTRQLLYDRQLRNFVRLNIRDGIDLQTLKMIWLWGDYGLEKLRRAVDLRNTFSEIVSNGASPLIVDLGTHSGMSATFFAYHYPEATVVTLEPSVENYQFALSNTSNYQNIVVENLAIGDNCATGVLEDPGLGSDAFRINYSRRDGSTKVVDMEYIFRYWPRPKFVPFLVKCDIEGGESTLFSSNTSWLKEFSLLIIELHDWLFPKMRTSNNFLKVAAQIEWDFVHSGENVFLIK